MSDNLARHLYLSSVEQPRRLALSVGGCAISYGALARFGRVIAGWLLAAGGGRAGRVGVLAGRSVGAYAGVVGSCWAGATYVPLGLNWPAERLIATLALVRLDALIIDAEAALLLTPQVLDACPKAILLADPFAGGLYGARFQSMAALADPVGLAPVPLSSDHIAYIMFTSGTTGVPKGVQVGLGAITHHLRVIQELYRFTADDRMSLALELTFDPSILNMFMAWNVGASLHVLSRPELSMPISFIQDHELSVWTSAPTVIGLLMRLGVLEQGALPRLRVSIFGGETLTLEAATVWQRAAPDSTIDNVYGPTELTIECLYQRLTDPPVVTPERECLAVGLPFAGNVAAILDQGLNFLPAGQAGELAVAGPQLAAGYLDQPELSAARFPMIDGTRWYLTGDKAYRDGEGRFHLVGRCDDQIKVRGYRVEPGDVESHLRQVCGTELVAVVAWPFANGGAIGTVGFVAGNGGETELSAREIHAALERRLPGYMVPQAIRRIAALPVTQHGKVDRKALVAMLEGEG